MNSQNPTQAGTPIHVHYEPLPDGTVPGAEDIIVRIISVKDYDAGLKHYDDELARVGFVCGRSKAWITTITPESYEALHATADKLNRHGFYEFCKRRIQAFFTLPIEAQAQALAAVSQAQQIPGVEALAPKPRRI